jgi:hypothetical protein
MTMNCKRNRTRKCICICHSKKRQRTRKCPLHSRKRNRVIKKLICIRRCVPIKQKCDDITTQTYFCVSSNSTIKTPSGIITIINTSKSCTMQIKIKSSNDYDVADVGPNSSFTEIVSNLKSVKILCKGQSDIDCTGSMELDLHYILMV